MAGKGRWDLPGVNQRVGVDYRLPVQLLIFHLPLPELLSKSPLRSKIAQVPRLGSMITGLMHGVSLVQSGSAHSVY